MIKCPFCHFENEDGALFCEQCKSDLSDVAPTAPAPKPAAPSRSGPPPLPSGPMPPPLPAMPPDLPPIAAPHLTIGSGGSFAPPPVPMGLGLDSFPAPPVEPPPFGGPPRFDPIPVMAVDQITPAEFPVIGEVLEATPIEEPIEAIPVIADVVDVDVLDPVDAVPVVPVIPFESPPVMPTKRPPLEPIAPPPVHPIAPPPLSLDPFAPPPVVPVVPVVAPPPPPPKVSPISAGEAAFPTGVEPNLVVMRGLKRNAKYVIYEGPNYIGRSDDKPVDIDLEDQEPPDRVWCSRQHAVIHFKDQSLSIEDLNSSNGTFVNRVKIYPGQIHPLKPDDVVQIGSVQMKVVI